MNTQHINARSLQYRMIQKNSPPAKVEDRWRRTTTTTLDFNKIWKELWNTLSNDQEKETLWKLTHRVLSTRCSLAKWEIRTTTKCPLILHSNKIYTSCSSRLSASKATLATRGNVDNEDNRSSKNNQNERNSTFQRSCTGQVSNQLVRYTWFWQNWTFYMEHPKKESLW